MSSDRDLQRKSVTSSNKPFSLTSTSVSWRAWLCHSNTSEQGVWARGARTPWTSEAEEQREAFPRPYFFPRMLYVLIVCAGSPEKFLLQYCCFEQFCSSSLSFIEITSFGILTTNRWEISFQISIFRIKHTFSLVLLTYNQRINIMETV